MKTSKFLTPAANSAAILLAFCGPRAVERSRSMPNFGLNTASSSFLSSARAGNPDNDHALFFGFLNALFPLFFPFELRLGRVRRRPRQIGPNTHALDEFLFCFEVKICMLLALSQQRALCKDGSCPDCCRRPYSHRRDESRASTTRAFPGIEQ